jgi:hypothetical protein
LLTGVQLRDKVFGRYALAGPVFAIAQPLQHALLGFVSKVSPLWFHISPSGSLGWVVPGGME